LFGRNSIKLTLGANKDVYTKHINQLVSNGMRMYITLNGDCMVKFRSFLLLDTLMAKGIF